MSSVKKVLLLFLAWSAASLLLGNLFFFFPYLSDVLFPFSTLSFSPPQEIVFKGPYPLLRTYKVTPGILEFWIKGGERDGIREGVFVVSGDYQVIGKVIKVGQRYSLVRTVYSPQLKIPAKIEDTEIVGSLKGLGDRVVFDFRWERDSPPEKGRITTLEFEGFSFPGLFLGEIERVEFNLETREGRAFLKNPPIPIFLYIIVGE